METTQVQNKNKNLLIPGRLLKIANQVTKVPVCLEIPSYTSYTFDILCMYNTSLNQTRTEISTF